MKSLMRRTVIAAQALLDGTITIHRVEGGAWQVLETAGGS